jgi:hypothetical protein
VFFILSKNQHNQLQAIATAKGLRNMNEALDYALGEISNPLMEEFHAKKAEHNKKRSEAFQERKKRSRKGGHSANAARSNAGS